MLAIFPPLQIQCFKPLFH